MGHVAACCYNLAEAASMLIAASLHGIGNGHASGTLAVALVIPLLSHRAGPCTPLQAVLLLLACHAWTGLETVEHSEACVKHRTKI